MMLRASNRGNLSAIFWTHINSKSIVNNLVLFHYEFIFFTTKLVWCYYLFCVKRYMCYIGFWHCEQNKWEIKTSMHGSQVVYIVWARECVCVCKWLWMITKSWGGFCLTAIYSPTVNFPSSYVMFQKPTYLV